MVSAGLMAVWLHMGDKPPEFAVLLLWEVTVGGVAMLIATFLSRPVDRQVLRDFYRQVTPPGAWGPVREGGYPRTPLLRLVIQWALLSASVFGAMFLVGALLVGSWADVAGYAVFLAAASGILWAIRKSAPAYG